MKRPVKNGNFAGILAAAGITPEAYRDPEIDIDVAAVAHYAAKYLESRLGPYTIPNTVFQNEIDSASHGFDVFSVQAQLLPEWLKDHKRLLVECVQPLLFDLFEPLNSARGDGFVAFTPFTLMTKRATTGANGTAGNVIAACFLWTDSGRVYLSIQVNALTNNPPARA
jgi:hypothetical protein